MRRLLLILALAPAALQPVHAADSPARLIEGEDSIEELLRLPGGLSPGRYEVHCETRIGSGGVPRTAHCYSLTNSAPGDLQRAVLKALRDTRFVPAIRNGHAIEVYAVLMVVVDTRLKEPLILAVPNNGVDAARYGLLYTAPQRFDDSYYMYQQQPLHTPDAGQLLMEFSIDEHGTIVDWRLRDESRTPQRNIERTLATMRRMQFLPGYFEGNPRPMLYVEGWFWRN